MGREKLRLGSLHSNVCPRPPVVRGLLRLAQMQGVILLYAVALTTALAVTGLEWTLSLGLKQLLVSWIGF